ncbi:MAG: ATP-binding protein [Candidatus Izimaplasma sp.]|nr:ATP-binding protein [Candidatus Izimaplasma bacterium]
MINRPLYLNKLIKTIDNDLVKILVGVRRSGKSTLLKMVKQYLLSHDVLLEQIIDINFEFIENDYLKSKDVFIAYVRKNLMTNKKSYLFVDEVQELDNWARIINSLKASENIDIYLTGSNARIFIGEHLTYLAGRYISFNVYPLSYEEFLDFKNIDYIDFAYYNDFLDSSFPAVVLETHKDIKTMMKQDMFDTIFRRDMIMRGNISNESMFFRVARYILEHIGSSISINKITNTLNSLGLKISYGTIDSYMDLMTKSYFIYQCQRYDIKGKEILKTNGKYYVVDFGIRDQLIPNKSSNTGKILENFIYLELVKHGYHVYVGKIGRDLEIDFVASKEDQVLYVQVSQSVMDPKTRERETKPFSLLKDMSKRYLVSFDSVMIESDYFVHLNVLDFINKL